MTDLPPRERRVFYDLLRGPSWVLASLLWDLRVFGAERVPARGPLVIVSNHESFLDSWILGFAAGPRLTFLAAAAYFRVPLLDRLMSALNAIPIPEGVRSRGALEEALRVLEAGRVLSLFPEGSRTVDGAIAPFQRGVALLASRSGVPVLPAAVRGAYGAWPRWRRLPRMHPIRVAFGEPVHYDHEFDSPRGFVDGLRRRVIELHESIPIDERSPVARRPLGRSRGEE